MGDMPSVDDIKDAMSDMSSDMPDMSDMPVPSNFSMPEMPSDLTGVDMAGSNASLGWFWRGGWGGNWNRGWNNWGWNRNNGYYYNNNWGGCNGCGWGYNSGCNGCGNYVYYNSWR